MIYYSSSTGTVIGSTAGSDLRKVTRLPSGSDYAIYIDDATVSGLNPNNAPGTYTMINIEPSAVYTVPTATGTLSFTEQSAADQLGHAQTAKITELQGGMVATLLAGFNSSATGTQYTYGFAESDQTNMSQELNIVNAGKAQEPIEWGIKSGAVINHTAAQFIQVCADGNNFKWAQVRQLRSLIAQVQAATTVAAVQAITWSPAAY